MPARHLRQSVDLLGAWRHDPALSLGALASSGQAATAGPLRRGVKGGGLTGLRAAGCSRNARQHRDRAVADRDTRSARPPSDRSGHRLGTNLARQPPKAPGNPWKPRVSVLPLVAAFVLRPAAFLRSLSRL